MKMITGFLTLICVICLISCNTEIQLAEDPNQLQTIPRLPIYLGSSYDLLKGNPKSSYGLDPGFMHPVFEYNYKTNQTTEDEKFLIPDEVSSHKMSTCSFATGVSTFRGSQSYQDDLKISASVSGGGSFFAKFSFSASSSYEKMQNTTSSEKKTVTHATAECQVYEILIDKFVIPPLTDDFVQGAVYCYGKGNWTEFIDQFGTHYAHEVVMGGRVTQEISYSFQSISKVQSLNVSVEVAAKASFASFFADASFDYKKYKKDISYSENTLSEKKYLYLGGQPQRDGNIFNWQQKVIGNPMPVQYKLFLLSELFKNINHKNFDAYAAAKQFEQALSEYCTRIQCKPPSGDFPKPATAKTNVQKTNAYGLEPSSSIKTAIANVDTSLKYHNFDSWFNSTTLDMTKLLIRSDKNKVYDVQLLLADGVTDLYTIAAGCSHCGAASTWDVPAGQHIIQVEYRYSAGVINRLNFVTNKGVKSPAYGGQGGTYVIVTFPDLYRIIGIYGQKTTNSLNKLGFYLGKTIYPSVPTDFEGEVFQNLSDEKILRYQLKTE